MSLRTHSTHDLLALLLGKRRAKKCSSGLLAAHLFAEDGTANYVPELAAARELVRRALEEKLHHRNVLSSPQEVADYLQAFLAGYEHEVFVVLFLNSIHQLISAEEFFRGTISQTVVYPREVAKRALALNAAAVIFAHNHPSGASEPSSADWSMTINLKHALALVDVRVLDHVVVAGNETVSFAERGWLRRSS